MPRVPDDLTTDQYQALRALRKLMRTNLSPSLPEWAEVLGPDGMSYPTAVRRRNALMEHGYIINTPGKTRSIRLTRKATELFEPRKKVKT